MTREYQIDLTRWYQSVSRTLESHAPHMLSLSGEDLSLAIAERLEALVEVLENISNRVQNVAVAVSKEHRI